MFNRGGYGGGFGRQPGQFSYSAMNVVTEVTIAVRQAAVGAVAWLFVAFVLQRVVVINAGDAIIAAQPAAYPAVVAVQTLIWRSWIVITALVHVGGLGVAMAANVLNPNWPPPFAAQTPADVVFPRYLRWLLGMGWLRSEKVEAQAMDAPTAQVEAPETRAVEATLLFRADDNDRKTYRGVVTLFTEEWERLGAMAQKRANFSVRELHRAGFRSPRDRDVAKMLSNARLTVGVGRDVVPVESFRRWLAVNGWQRPTLPDGETVTV